MEHDLSISLQGFSNEDTARYLGHLTLETIRNLEQKYTLNISRLKKVVISFDYPVALQEIANEFNHKSSPIFTNSKQAKGVAQLLSRVEHGGKYSEYALVLSVDFFIELFDDTGEISLVHISKIIHRIHHELIHVHEHNLNSLDSSRIIDDYDDAFLITGKRAWSEYLANYMSSQTAPDDSIQDVLFTFETVLKDVPTEIEGFIKSYKIDQLSLAEMHTAVTQRIKLIANMYAYAHGYINGANIDTKVHFPNLLILLSESMLAISLKALGEALVSIKCKFDDGGLCDYDDFNSSIKAIRAMYASFGLQVDRAPDPGMGLHIHVY